MTAAESSCCKAVFSGWRNYPCGRKGKLAEDGKFYCGVHSPDAVQKRQAKRDASYAALRTKWEAEARHRRFAAAAEAAIREIAAGHNDPHGLAAKTLAILGESKP